MDEFTKNDIGKKVYAVNAKYINSDGAVYINLGVLTNVSVEGDYAKVSLHKDANPEELKTALLAKSYAGLKSVFEKLLEEYPSRKLMAYIRDIDRQCICIVDRQTTDKYGDTTFCHEHRVGGENPMWKYGTSTDIGLMTIDEVCAFIDEHLNRPFGIVYTMDKSTDNWWMCPHCGSSDTDIDEEHGGGDERFAEYYSCRKCNCRWVNIYGRAPRITRKLIK